MKFSRELSFKKGDIIYIRRQIDKNWYEGEHNAMIGLLPVQYVDVRLLHNNIKYNSSASLNFQFSLVDNFQRWLTTIANSKANGGSS
jgi:hypothetical protein